jgi:hypothetical protein
VEADRKEVTTSPGKVWQQIWAGLLPFSWFRPDLPEKAEPPARSPTTEEVRRRTCTPPADKTAEIRPDWQRRKHEITGTGREPVTEPFVRPGKERHSRSPEHHESPRPRPLRHGGVAEAGGPHWWLPVEPGQSGAVADRARVGDLEVRAASVVGVGHRHEEPATTRQDAFRLGRDRLGEHLLVAVADGVSAASRSDLGATVAVRAAVDLLRGELDSGRRPDEIDFATIFKTVSQHVVGAANQTGVDPQELMTALVVAIVPARPANAHGDRVIRIASVGDASAWVLERAVWQQVAGEVKSGLDLNALDSFLPHLWKAVATKTVGLPGGSVLALMSDGVGDALCGIEGGAAWFAERWRRPPALTAFLADVDYTASGYVDDRTAVVVWPMQTPETVL